MSIYNGNEFGSITVIWGSMYCGKSEELQRQMDRAKYGGKKYQLFKPKRDDRYNKNKVTTHYGKSLDAIVVDSAKELLQSVDKDTKVIGIDEGQFFDDELYEICKTLKTEYHMDVFISGLDMKFNGEPFELMMKLAAISNDCIKLKAVCRKCGENAYISHRLIDDESDIVVGSEGTYIALCEKHHLQDEQIKWQKKFKKMAEQEEK